MAIQDLTSTNKTLRADWEARRIPIFILVRDLVVEESSMSNLFLEPLACISLPMHQILLGSLSPCPRAVNWSYQ